MHVTHLFVLHKTTSNIRSACIEIYVEINKSSAMQKNCSKSMIIEVEMPQCDERKYRVNPVMV